ncbi:hypothetical protein HUO13_16945 [Saccharopolyspora erythraea]|nr:hypothetical protein HUO13_16945 [Saccharopolyspora erythraea]
MTDGLGRLALPTVFVLGFAVALWSDRARARKLARRWGVPEPSADQVEAVLHYRRLRLACYPLLYVVAGVCCGLLLPPEPEQADKTGQGGYLALVAMFFFGAVIAELLTVARTRELQPLRLHLADVAPRWGVGLFSALVLATFAFGLVDLQAQPHITPNVLLLAAQNKQHTGAPIAVPFAGTALVVLLVAFVLWSARTRSSSADAELDRALRNRSARVVLGLGIGMQVSLLALVGWRMELLYRFATGADLSGAQPAEVVVEGWAREMVDLVQPWTLLIVTVGMIGWLFVANPGKKAWKAHPAR